MTINELRTDSETRHLARSGLTLCQQQQVEQRVADCLARLETLIGIGLETPQIRFDLAGTCAGQYLCQQRVHCLRFNPYLLSRHFSESLNSTVPHEVAHYAVALLHGKRRVRPHGSQWQQVMHLLDANPDRTHSFDLSDIPTRHQRRWPYRCSCSKHELSTTRHNRSLRGARYYCRLCHDLLVAA